MKTIKFLLTLIGLISFSAMAQPPVTQYWAYWDNDGDGHFSKIREITQDQVITFLNAGWDVANHRPQMDCDDYNDLVFHSVKGWIDNDGDKRTSGWKLLCIGSVLPTGYILTENAISFGDCDDTDPKVWRSKCLSDNPCTANWTACIGDVLPPGTVFCTDELPCNPKKLSMEIYPNPVHDRLNITSNDGWKERVEIKLVDQYARTLKTLRIPNAVKGQNFSINTSDLKPGLYHLTIRRGELNESKTIAVKL